MYMCIVKIHISKYTKICDVLQKDNAPISTSKGPQHSHIEQTEDRGGEITKLASVKTGHAPSKYQNYESLLNSPWNRTHPCT